MNNFKDELFDLHLSHNPSLELHSVLSICAQYHSQWMAFNTLSHRGFPERVKPYPHMKLAENIAHGQSSPEEVMKSWLKSPMHKKNIIHPYTHIGIGYYHSYWCVIYGIPL